MSEIEQIKSRQDDLEQKLDALAEALHRVGIVHCHLREQHQVDGKHYYSIDRPWFPEAQATDVQNALLLLLRKLNLEYNRPVAGQLEATKYKDMMGTLSETQ